MQATPQAAGHLRIRELRKVYGKGIVANDGISLDVRPGEVFGLLGPNGAGKTTLVNQTIGLLKPTSGSIRLGEIDLVERPAAARQLCSYLPQGELPIDSFPMRKAVQLIGRIRGGDAESVARRTSELIEALELTEWSETLGNRLSGGVKRLVGFIVAAVEPGRVMILDEPTNDVDPLRRRLLWQEIRKVADSGTAVLLVTHNVLEAERAVDRLAVIDAAKILAVGTPAALKEAHRGELRLRITLEPGVDTPHAPSFALETSTVGRRLLVSIDENGTLPAIEWARELLRCGIAEEYELAPPNLEDAYVNLIRRENNGNGSQLVEMAR
jgi:ABC-2 type transport system ATP-binding protein